MTEHHSSRRAQKKRSDSDRQQTFRDRMKATGTPTTHVLDRALVEGLMYQMDLQRARGVDLKEMQIPVQYVFAYATAILTAQTNASDRYNLDAVIAAIRKRIARLNPRKFRLTYIPKEERRTGMLPDVDYAEAVKMPVKKPETE